MDMARRGLSGSISLSARMFWGRMYSVDWSWMHGKVEIFVVSAHDVLAWSFVT